MLDEAEYLALQSARAKARFRRTARTLADEVLAPLELRPLIRKRPWWSLGAALLGGLACGLLLGGRGRGAGAGPSPGEVDGLLASAGRQVGRALRSALGALALANLRGGMAAPAAPETNGDGAAGAPEERLEGEDA